MDIDLYSFFELHEECSAKDLKRAYKRKARELHPDKNKDNPRAKEQFQQLKEHYDILHDPTTRREYDKKWKARRESLKRHAALDEQRKRLKEKLEVREAQARLLREQQRRAVARDVVADQIRREWEKHSEEAHWDAMVNRKRQQEAEALQQTSTNPRNGHSVVIKVKWTVGEMETNALCYTKEFITTCLSEYGELTAVIMGKRGSAVAEFAQAKDAMAAVEASRHDLIGFPTLPLQLAVIKDPSSNDEPSVTSAFSRPEHTNNTTPVANDINSSSSTDKQSIFDAFESDILTRMAAFNQ